MAKVLLVLFAVCVVLPAIATAHFIGSPFTVKGKVYCDTCNCGFETDHTKYLSGAAVKIECKDRKSGQITYTKDGMTEADGSYTILVETDRGDDFCDVVLGKSSDPECSSPDSGRDRSRVILTRNNGMMFNTRSANAMGYLVNTPLAGCPQILEKYQLYED